MLELLREFGMEQLESSGESEAIRHRHATFFLALAEQAEARLESAEQVQWMNRLEQEHDNLRAALEWSKTGGRCRRIMLAISWRARIILGSAWLFQRRARAAVGCPCDRNCTGTNCCTRQAARTGGRTRLSAKRLSRRPSHFAASESGHLPGNWGQAGHRSRTYQARKCSDGGGRLCRLRRQFLEEALTIWRDLKDKHGTARALISLGWVALRSGDYQLANTRLEEALSLIPRIEGYQEYGL